MASRPSNFLRSATARKYLEGLNGPNCGLPRSSRKTGRNFFPKFASCETITSTLSIIISSLKLERNPSAHTPNVGTNCEFDSCPCVNLRRLQAIRQCLQLAAVFAADLQRGENLARLSPE